MLKIISIYTMRNRRYIGEGNRTYTNIMTINKDSRINSEIVRKKIGNSVSDLKR